MGEKALEGFKMHLPRHFRRMCVDIDSSFPCRIAQLRKDFAIEGEALWREYEEKEERSEW